ncbi:Uncharacterised protein [uncultured archaeon]|nr:Uncharacterised protein [uncultured archaeon]
MKENNLASRLFAYITDFGDIKFCRGYNIFLKEFFNKKARNIITRS